MTIDKKKLETLMGQMLNDIGAAFMLPLVRIGDKLGLYQALVEGGPMNSQELAARTACAERYIREWLAANAASGYVDYDEDSGKFSLSDEQALVFANDHSEFCLQGAYQSAVANVHDIQKIMAAFKSGEGVGWGEHSACLFQGTSRTFRVAYEAHLVKDWLPALDGVEARLNDGARVADVGCGHGYSTILMAQAYPQSHFVGFDFHPESVEAAREAAAQAGVSDNTTFEVALAKDFPGSDYDLVACFDCLHDMGDPVGASKHILQSLKPDGTWLIVEPFANDALEDNFNARGRLMYAGSTMVCTPASLSQEVGLGLGAQAGEQRLREVTAQGGFTRFRRATETSFNLVLEARP